MKNSNANARAADSNLIHKFPWKWYLSDLDKVKKNGLTVFSCFSCGGGSSMGYKLAGYDVIGNVEIDPRVMAVYQKKQSPTFSVSYGRSGFSQIGGFAAGAVQLGYFGRFAALLRIQHRWKA